MQIMDQLTRRWGEYLLTVYPDLSAQLTKAVGEGAEPTGLVAMVSDGTVRHARHVGSVLVPRWALLHLTGNMRTLKQGGFDVGPVIDLIQTPRYGALPVLGFYRGASTFAIVAYEALPIGGFRLSD